MAHIKYCPNCCKSICECGNEINNLKTEISNVLIKDILKSINYIKSYLDTLYAIECLEYHDKNYLAYSPKKLSEEKQELVNGSLSQIIAIKTLLENNE